MANDALAQKAQNFTNRGRQAMEGRKFDLAVEMFLQALTFVPDALETRRMLRAAQIAKFKSNPPSALALKMQGMGSYFARQKVLGLAKKGQGVEAMAEAEKLMCQNPLDPNNIECAVKAAEAANKPEAAAVTVEAAYECGNNDPALLERVATYYTIAKRYDKARDAYSKLVALRPGDQRILQLLKNTEAQATMSAGWNDAVGKKGGFQQILANKEQAKKLDQANKAMVVGSDADALIAEKIAQIEKEPGNLNFYRALARLYAQNKRFGEAIATLEKAVSINSSDPELDRMLSSTRIGDYEYRIEQLKAAGKTAEAEELEAEKNQFVFDDLADRVARYPNDLHLHFELGLQYFTYEYFDDAIQHFQLSQKSPKDRLESLYYLAMCFVKQGQLDMGVMQLETARDQIPTMDELKKKIVYQLGLCAEQAGDLEKAYAYYKDVYSTDVTFADLNTRMLDVAAKLKAAKA
jgi:tetratricopeptide (TPR) repeat protein